MIEKKLVRIELEDDNRLLPKVYIVPKPIFVRTLEGCYCRQIIGKEPRPQHHERASSKSMKVTRWF
jgi:hypothetical protein